MLRYVVLGKFTEQGIKSIKESPTRVERARESMAKVGARMELFLYTQGAYDFVTVAEFPDEASAMTFLLALGAQGNVRTETLRAYTPEEVAGFIARIP